MANTPRTEFAQAIRALATERGLDADVILESVKQAIAAAYKRDARDQGEEVEEMELDVEIDPVSGETKVFSEGEDITPPGFGRIAAQTAKQVIHQKIREAEKGVIMDEFTDRVGGLISGVILSFDGPNVRVDVGRTEAYMPAEERIPNERLNPSQRMTFLLKKITETPRGKQIFLSRSDPDFVAKLFAREVPEIASNSVEIKGIARQPGIRTKIAVFSNQTGVDPVGSCVGQKGVRVQSVTNELGGERVDIVPWSEDPAEFIKASLAPVTVISIKLDEDEEEAEVIVPEDELSLAIGKDGQNVRLASELTGWDIDIKGQEAEGKEDEETEDEGKEAEVIAEKGDQQEEAGEPADYDSNDDDQEDEEENDDKEEASSEDKKE